MNVRCSAASYPALRRSRLIAAASGLLTAAVFVAPDANAVPPPSASPEVIAAMETHLGSDSTAGSYYDQTADRMVVAVTDSTAAQAVQAAGAVAKTVKYSAAYLERAGKAIENSANIAGTAWGVDVRGNALVVSADSRVTGAQLARLRTVAKDFGDAVRIERVSGTFRKLIEGGDAIYSRSWRCSLGFNVRRGTAQYFLTAGHCTQGYPVWYADATRIAWIGRTVDSSFPGNDYGIVRYDNPAIPRPGSAGGQDIATAANAYVGQSACRDGSTSGVHCGQVTGLNQTVNYGDGDIVYGMIRTNICGEPGDSGGPLYAGDTALGLTSGGTGNCSWGGTTFFNPVPEVLNRYGVSIY